jgi:hypothetical protein
MQRCMKCVLPVHKVQHNSHGICIRCQEYTASRESWDSGKDDFLKMVDKFKGKGKKYDFLVPITGGKDSVFLLYCMTYMVKDARILAFTWDHGFHRKQAWRNIKNAVQAAKIDHRVFCILDIPKTMQLYRGFLEVYGSPCRICAIFQESLMIKHALEEDIPLIITGDISGQAGLGIGRIPVSSQGIKSSLPFRIREISIVAKRAGINNINEILHETFGTIIENANAPNERWPSFVKLGSFFNWNSKEEMVIKELGDKLFFKKPFNTMIHTSCELSELRGYLMFKQRNLYWPIKRNSVSEFEKELSLLVREGAITRNQALRELELLGMKETVPEIVNNFNTTIGITMKDFERYLAKRISLLLLYTWFLFKARSFFAKLLGLTLKQKIC